MKMIFKTALKKLLSTILGSKKWNSGKCFLASRHKSFFLYVFHVHRGSFQGLSSGRPFSPTGLRVRQITCENRNDLNFHFCRNEKRKKKEGKWGYSCIKLSSLAKQIIFFLPKWNECIQFIDVARLDAEQMHFWVLFSFHLE